jgi:antitoxin (DNA-binding transcriptional repressor) of toxin-antitoxin stability system
LKTSTSEPTNDRFAEFAVTSFYHFIDRRNASEGIIVSMAPIHISEADAARDFAGLLARVREGAEIVIESGTAPVAILRRPAPPRRSIEECVALLPEDSTATIDEDFARDVEEAMAAHREPLNSPAWD